MEQTQTKLSKYAAKQARLAADPNFGTTYEVKTREEELAEKQAAAQPIDVANHERQARLDKILKMQLEIRTLEHRIENATAHIAKLTAAIERQKELMLQ